jgi:nickel/cobalt exporter
LLALGISGGLLPRPSALVLMLSAISPERVGYGLLLTLIFSLGLATTLTAVGLIFPLSRQNVRQFVARAKPVYSKLCRFSAPLSSRVSARLFAATLFKKTKDLILF